MCRPGSLPFLRYQDCAAERGADSASALSLPLIQLDFGGLGRSNIGMSRQGKVRAFLQVHLAQILALAVIFFFAPSRISAQTTPTVLTNAADVLSLSADKARQKIPVMVRGIVTAAEPGWNGQFFVQDATSGVFVENRSDDYPKPGDEVEVKGFSQPGAFAPIIGKPTWKALGHGPLPKAKPVLLDQLMTGAEDGQRVEISGIVRSVSLTTEAMDIEVASGGNRIHVFRHRSPDIKPQSLLGARIRVSGTVAASFNRALRHLMYVVMFVPEASDFVVEQMEDANPFERPVTPLSGIAEYRRDIEPGQRVHVKGVVTLQRVGQDLFLQDASGGLHVQTHQTNQLAVGEVIDVVGFPEFDHYLPVLNDAIFRTTSETRSPTPKAFSIPDLGVGMSRDDFITNHAALVTLPTKVKKAGALGSGIARPVSRSFRFCCKSTGDFRIYRVKLKVPPTDDRLTLHSHRQPWCRRRAFASLKAAWIRNSIRCNCSSPIPTAFRSRTSRRVGSRLDDCSSVSAFCLRCWLWP